jgi:phage terminase Nu1 subunit (DNA packaging protein)
MKPNDCTLTELATVLGISSNSAAKHSEQFRIAHGRYDLARAVQRYTQTKVEEAVHHAGGRGALAAARTRKALADANMSELQLLEKKRALVDTQAAINEFTTAISNIKSRMLALPSREAPRLAMKSVTEVHAGLKSAVHGILRAVAHAAQQAADDLRSNKGKVEQDNELTLEESSV